MQKSPQSSQVVESKFTGDDVVALSAELGASLVSQRTYGKQGEDIRVLTKVFLDDLKAYEPVKVLLAIKQWRKTDPNFPTPADIEAILNPKPKFDYAVYQRLLDRSKRENLYHDEWKYIKAYEQNVMRGL